MYSERSPPSISNLSSPPPKTTGIFNPASSPERTPRRSRGKGRNREQAAPLFGSGGDGSLAAPQSPTRNGRPAGNSDTMMGNGNQYGSPPTAPRAMREASAAKSLATSPPTTTSSTHISIRGSASGTSPSKSPPTFPSSSSAPRLAVSPAKVAGAWRDTSTAASRWATSPPTSPIHSNLPPLPLLPSIPPPRPEVANPVPPPSIPPQSQPLPVTSAVDQIDALLAKVRLPAPSCTISATTSIPYPLKVDLPPLSTTVAPPPPPQPPVPPPTLPPSVAISDGSNLPPPVKKTALGGRSQWDTDDSPNDPVAPPERNRVRGSRSRTKSPHPRGAPPKTALDIKEGPSLLDRLQPLLLASQIHLPLVNPRPTTPSVEQLPSTPIPSMLIPPSTPPRTPVNTLPEVLAETPSRVVPAHIDWAADDDDLDDLPPLDDWLLPGETISAAPPSAVTTSSPPIAVNQGGRRRSSGGGGGPTSSRNNTPIKPNPPHLDQPHPPHTPFSQHVENKFHGRSGRGESGRGGHSAQAPPPHHFDRNQGPKSPRRNHAPLAPGVGARIGAESGSMSPSGVVDDGFSLVRGRGGRGGGNNFGRSEGVRVAPPPGLFAKLSGITPRRPVAGEGVGIPLGGRGRGRASSRGGA